MSTSRVSTCQLKLNDVDLRKFSKDKWEGEQRKTYQLVIMQQVLLLNTYIKQDPKILKNKQTEYLFVNK